jgi:hypothetical protein
LSSDSSSNAERLGMESFVMRKEQDKSLRRRAGRNAKRPGAHSNSGPFLSASQKW